MEYLKGPWIYITIFACFGIFDCAYGECAIARKHNYTCDYEVVCKKQITDLEGLSQCHLQRGSKGQHSFPHVKLHLVNLSADSIKAVDVNLTYEKYVNSVQAFDNSWPYITGGFFTFCISTKVLNISSNNIKFLKPGAFHGLENLEVLDISHNNIEKLPVDMFRDQAEDNRSPKSLLKLLNLSHNKIRVINKNTFADIHSLEQLDLSHNEISKLFLGSFEGLHYLKFMCLDFNRIDRFNKSLYHLRSLTNLNASHNILENIFPYDTKNMAELVRIDLSYNMVNYIDKKSQENATVTKNLIIFSDKMVYIDLSHNQLKKITNLTFHEIDNANDSMSLTYYEEYTFRPKTLNVSFNGLEEIYYDAFDGVNSFAVLDLSNNLMDSFYINTRNLRHLEKLYLQKNSLNTITDACFSGMYNLKYLDISRNDIFAIDKNAFIDLAKLSVLKLSQNLLGYLDLVGLENLQYLDLSYNNLSNLTLYETRSLKTLILRSNKLQHLGDLETERYSVANYLDLSKNLITDIDENTFRFQMTLKHLILGYNKLSIINPGSFLFLAELKSLHLDHNYIREIKMGAFTGLFNLELLDLSSNKLVNLKTEPFMELNSLKTLIVDNNNIHSLDLKVFVNRKSPLKLSIGRNDFSCDWISKAFQDYGDIITLDSIRHPNYKKENIFGIECYTNSIGKVSKAFTPAAVTTPKPDLNKKLLEAITNQSYYMERIEFYSQQIANTMLLYMEKKDENILDEEDNYSSEDNDTQNE